MKAKDKKLYEIQAEIFQAIAHPIRLAVIDVLSDGEKCVCDIARQVDAKRSNVSRHLSVMLKAGVLDVRRDGLKMIYKLKMACVPGFVSCVTETIRQKIKDESAMLRGL
jgi:ArsR family transcriptional regulator